jgi:hypothetical protein
MIQISSFCNNPRNAKVATTGEGVSAKKQWRVYFFNLLMFLQQMSIISFVNSSFQFNTYIYK